LKKQKKTIKNNHGISEEFIAFILHSIYNGTIFKRDKSNSAKNEDLELEVRFALLHSHILKCINSNYHNCINFLLQEGIIICDGIFKKKESHLDIELSDDYETRKVCVVEYDFDVYQRCKNSKDSNVRRYLRKMEFNKEVIPQREYLFEPFRNSIIKIDVRQANSIIKKHFEALKTKYDPKNKKFKKLTSEQYFYSVDLAKNRQFQIIDLIDKGEYNLETPFDEFGNRFHSLISQLKSEARSTLTFNGQRLISIDIKNSQPFCLTAIFNQDFFKNIQDNPFCFHNLCPTLSHHILSIQLPLKVLTNSPEFQNEISEYIKLVTSGQLYERFLSPDLVVNSEEYHYARDNVKKAILRLFYRRLFERRANASNPLQLSADELKIYKSFPCILELMHLLKNIYTKEYKNRLGKNNRWYKEDIGFTHFTRLMQRIESYIVLDRICNVLYQRIPEATPITIHDSIILPARYKFIAMRTIKRECRKILGYAPELDTKLLCNVNKIEQHKFSFELKPVSLNIKGIEKIME
jgi:hypothetical protein